MSHYAIGDIQGCRAEFRQLLELIGFSEASDRLWITGDLVNRGPESLGALRDVKALGDAVVTVLPVPAEHHPYWVFFREPDGALRPSTGIELPTRRQDLPPAFHREGSVYVTRRDVVLERGSLYGSRVLGYPVPPTVNIDTEEDWRRAEELLAGA